MSEVLQNAADWKRQVMASLRSGDIEEALQLATQREIVEMPAGNIGYMSLGMIIINLGNLVDMQLDTLMNDPTIKLLKQRFGKREVDYFSRSKENMEGAVKTLQKEGVLPADFIFEEWWDSLPSVNF